MFHSQHECLQYVNLNLPRISIHIAYGRFHLFCLEIVHSFVEKHVQKLKDFEDEEADLFAPDMSFDEEGNDDIVAGHFLETVISFFFVSEKVTRCTDSLTTCVHLYGFSLIYVLMCLARLSNAPTSFLHFLSCMCFHMCVTRQNYVHTVLWLPSCMCQDVLSRLPTH